MVAASCSYKVEPLRSPPPPWIRDAGVVEGAAAVAYLREHAAELNIDTSRVANGGGSAGGYVAAGAAFVPLGVGGPGGAGCPDLSVLFNPGTGAGAPRPGRPDVAPTTPAKHVASGGPATIVFHGEADTTVRAVRRPGPGRDPLPLFANLTSRPHGRCLSRRRRRTAT